MKTLQVYPTQEELFKLFDKQALLERCEFIWRVPAGNRARIGSKAGSFTGRYWRIQIGGNQNSRVNR